MNPAGADVAITDTIPPTLATQLAPDRATAGQATTTAAPGGPSTPCGDTAQRNSSMNGTIIAALPIAAMFGFAGYRVGTGRGRPVLGAVLGFALGLIGLGIFMLIPRTAEAQARHDRERAERQQPEQLTQNQDTVR